MKFKYYLRGIGIGIVITTIIFMISISLHKNDEIPQNKPEIDTESKTVAEVQNHTETEDENAVSLEQTTETEKIDTEAEKKAEQDKKPGLQKNTQLQKDTEKESESSEPKKEPSENQLDSKNTEKVRFEINGGEYSDVVCRKLAEAGLVDSAESFNKFLVEKDYDNGILPGVYDIPKDSTYEEIARLLTTKI